MPQVPDKIRRVTDATKAMTRRQRKFLDALSVIGTVTGAAKAAGVDQSLPYKWRKQDAAFREAWDSLADQVGTVIESALVERVVNGVEEPLTYQGQIFGYVKRFDNSTGVALLRGMKPEKYRESGGGAINVNVRTDVGVAVLPQAALSEEDWEKESIKLTDMQNKVTKAALANGGVVIEGKAEVLRTEPIRRGG